MELDEEARYAVAALFTLMLHAAEHDCNSTASGLIWGEPVAVERDPHAIADLTDAELEAFWGFDCVADGGLLDRLYKGLQVPSTKWRGLKLLPSAAPSSADPFFNEMCRGLIAMLDADLAASLPPLVACRSTSRRGRPGDDGDSPASPPQQRRDVPDHLFDGLIDIDSDSEGEGADEDWAADVAREKKLQRSAEGKRSRQPPLRRVLSGEAKTAVMAISKRLSGGLTLHSDASSDEEDQGQQVGEKQAEQVPATPAGASPKAMGAVWELVQCCVGFVPLPLDAEAPRWPRPVAVRWYDARARVALLRVAQLLQVSPRKVSNLETLLTHSAPPKSLSLSVNEEDAWQRRMRYFKVGAAAVGGGALFAVTGGLAAPAIAGGVATILGFIGAPTALAGTVTGFLASTAGAATFTGTVAASGAASTGTRMAYRTADVTEFGFEELIPVATFQPPQEQELQPLQRRLCDQLASTADSPGGDRGHLSFASTGYQTAREDALCQAGTERLGSSRGRRTLQPRTLQPQQQPAAQTPEPQAEQQSAWQRWFKGSSTEEEALLLPVPMRARQNGDVKLSVTIFVAGWITERKDFERCWQSCVTSDADCFALVWESKVLLQLNSALGKLLTMQAAGQGLQLATHSFLYAGAGLVAALGPTVLLGAISGQLIANSWQVASERAVKAGKLLAHQILNSGAHGDRPVSLMGHGFGAALIFSCLVELCRAGARGIVQHAVLMGTPVSTEPLRWRMARRAVSGRLINCFTSKDWLLGVCAGGSSGWMAATAGLVAVEGVNGVENANLTKLVDGHLGYLDSFDSILDMLAL